MTPERWQQIDKLLEAALEQAPEDRKAFLDQACAGDSTLRNEVESLLRSDEQAKNFIESPALEVAAESLAKDEPALVTGQTLGPYTILSRLGAGGMGEVYLAQDSRLERRVALKLLPEHLSKDQERARRFKLEARAASALSHANVATIYEIGQFEGTIYIAMEYVEGQTLRRRIQGRALPTSEIVDVALQAADALDEAHTRGITHRDIKSPNIMITPRGQVKVLDFGLAKLISRQEQSSGHDSTTYAKTEPGLLMGTVAYMSPEQALGRNMDHRTDIFSLGVVLYEMSTGRTPFRGGTTMETIDRIVHMQPEAITRFNSDAPAELERIIRKCMEKDRDRRYENARELLADLKNLRRDIDSGAAATARVTTDLRSHHRRWFQLVAIFLTLLAVGMGTYFSLRDHQAGRTEKTIPSLVVLPLVNASSDADSDYLSDGITESIINSLSQLSKLRVIARTTAFRYKGKNMDPQSVGRELGVDAVLTGKVLQQGEMLTVQTELIHVADGTQFWGERYNRRLSDIFAVQEEIAGEISEKLQLKLTGQEQQRLTKRYTENARAYQLYLRGRFHWNKFNEEGLNKAIGYFNQALEIDPGYALAYVGLSDCYGVQGAVGIVPPMDVWPKARMASEKAVALDDTLAEAHCALGDIKTLFEWDWPTAEKELQRAIEINPNYGQAHELYSYYLDAQGSPNQALSEIKRAQELDPLSPIINLDLAWAFHYLHRYDEALDQFRKTLELDPNPALGPQFLPGLAYANQRMFDEAVGECQKAISSAGRDPSIVSVLGYVYGMFGKTAEAHRLVGELTEKWSQRYFPPFDIALIYTGLGEKDKALDWLEKGEQARDPQLIWLKVEPEFDPLRSEPRYSALLQRMGLASNSN